MAFEVLHFRNGNVAIINTDHILLVSPNGEDESFVFLASPADFGNGPEADFVVKTDFQSLRRRLQALSVKEKP